MSLDYIKIHFCRNDCILYWKDYENLKEYPRCGESCYKLKDNGVEDDDGVIKKRCSFQGNVVPTDNLEVQ